MLCPNCGITHAKHNYCSKRCATIYRNKNNTKKQHPDTGYVLCSKCDVEKPPSEFYKANSTLMGLQSSCKDCERQVKLKYRQTPQYKAALAVEQANNCQRRYIRHIWRTFGITYQEYNWLLEQQMGVCAICEKPSDKRLAVDHAHGHHPGEPQNKGCKGCIRGLLCFLCNRRVAPYLEKRPKLQNEWFINYQNGRPLLTPPIGADSNKIIATIETDNEKTNGNPSFGKWKAIEAQCNSLLDACNAAEPLQACSS